MSSNLTKIIEHKGKSIIYTDLTDVSPEMAIDAAKYIVKAVQACDKESALTLTNLTNARYNRMALAEMLETQKSNLGYVKKGAVVGLNKIAKTIFQTYCALSSRDMKIFDNIEEAKDWLVE